MGKEKALFKCALLILDDGCPPDRSHYLCMKQESEDEDCKRCWCRYLYEVINGTAKPETA